MILEGIITTLSSTGEVNIAPMGPSVDPGMTRFQIRPFRTSQTYQNLKTQGEGVFHVTDDALMLARAALGKLEPFPRLLPANQVKGFYLQDTCRFYEFRVCSFDERNQRSQIDVEVVHSERLRDFFGFNRAKHAVVEAAILATRTDFLPVSEIETEFQKLGQIVAKTGGPQEKQAFEILSDHLSKVRARAGRTRTELRQ